MGTFRQGVMVGLGIWALSGCAPSNTAATPEVQQVQGRVATDTDLPPGPGWREVARGAWVVGGTGVVGVLGVALRRGGGAASARVRAMGEA